MTPAESEAADVAEIRALMRDYIAWFSAGDTKRIADEAYHMPFQAFLPTGPVAVTSVEGASLALTALITAMRVGGYARSTMAEPVITLLHAKAAIASGAVTRFREDGSVIETLGSSYLLGKTLHGWRIISIFTHSADTVVRAVPVSS